MYSSDGGDANSRDAVRDALLDVLRQRPAGLITDIDGTISPIVLDRRDAHVLPEAVQAIQSLRRSLDLVAVVTGRTVADARRMLDVPGLIYVGNHGFEMWAGDHPRLVPEAEAWVNPLADVLAELQETIKTPGVTVENKLATGSIHYRLAKDPDRAKLDICAAVEASPAARHFKLEEGRRVMNLLPPIAVSKGSATHRLATQYGLRGLVYLGDDVTDLHGFEALAELHRMGQCRTLAIGVVGAGSPADIMEMADIVLPSPRDAAAALWAAAQVLEAERGMHNPTREPASAVREGRGTMALDA